MEKLEFFREDYSTLDGTGVHDYIYVIDLAEGHVAALDNLSEGIYIYNLGIGKGTSVLELMRVSEESRGITIPYEIVNRRHGDIAECYADVSKVKSEHGWMAKRDLLFICGDAWCFENSEMINNRNLRI